MRLSLFPDLRTRRRRPELMDQPGLDEGLHRQALRGLERVNGITGSAGILWPAIRRAARAQPDRPLRVLDVACGAGDVPLSLARTAARRRIALEIDGCDLSPTAVAHAREKAQRTGAAVGFFERDALAAPLPGGYDVLTCSLFLHHLDEDDAVRLLANMAGAAGRMVLVSDLVRSRVGYVLAWWGTRLLTRSPIVHADGPLSVAGAFTPHEALQLAERAGLTGAAISRHWPQRFLLTWSPLL